MPAPTLRRSKFFMFFATDWLPISRSLTDGSVRNSQIVCALGASRCAVEGRRTRSLENVGCALYDPTWVSALGD